MKNIDNIITETINKFLIKEAYAPLYWDFIEEYDESYILRAFRDNPQYCNIWSPLINPMQYQKALDEFTQYGQLIRFPEKIIRNWIYTCLRNIALLRANTCLNGHSSHNDVDAFVDVFFDGDEYAWNGYCQSIDADGWSAEYAYLYEHGFEEWEEKSDVDCDISDYGLAPLERLACSYNDNMSPEETLVLINKIIDIVHCNGDLSALFIKGGASTLNRISNPQVYSPYGVGIY